MSKKEIAVAVGAIVALAAVLFGIAWFGASLEARAYNRITGSDVTTAEALVVNLRVDCP